MTETSDSLPRLRSEIGPSLSPEAYARMTERLDDDATARLAAVLESPSEETWNNAFSLIVGTDRFTTLWQAVRKADPSFPSRGPIYESETGCRLRGWSVVPSRQTLIRAIWHASRT